MGTKAVLLIMSWVLAYVNNKYIPLDWEVLSLSVKSLCYGVCSGYCAWLFWYDQQKIMAIFGGVLFHVKGKFTK